MSLAKRPIDYGQFDRHPSASPSTATTGGGLRPAAPSQARRPHASGVAVGLAPSKEGGDKKLFDAETGYYVRVGAVGAAVIALLAFLSSSGTLPVRPPPIPPPRF